MTKEEILAIEVGEKLDAYVLHYVLGIDKWGIWVEENGSPSMNISVAWQVMKKFPGMKVTFLDTLRPSVIEECSYLKKLPDGRLEWFTVQYGNQIVRAREAPEAICKVALLVKLEDKSA